MARSTGWSYTAGEKGRNRVRAYADAKTGIILLEFYTRKLGSSEPKRERKSLGHRDRTRAKQAADELAAAFGKDGPSPVEGMTLRELFDIYLREVTPEKGLNKRKHDLRCAEMFLRFFGANQKPKTLNRRDWDRFVRERRVGKICPAASRSGRGVRARVIAYDLTWLRSVLNWSTQAGDGRGGLLLERNPISGFPLPREENPQRPMVSQDRFERMLAVADQVDSRFRLALKLANETGHRIGSIRQLKWADVDLPGRRIRWRAETDKIGSEHWTPLTSDAAEALEDARRENPAIGDAWVFPSPEDGAKPCSRYLVNAWWGRGEACAGLDHVPQIGWHGLRRKFATELDGAPLKVLCALGGWKDPQTILKCYQKAEEPAMRDALLKRANRAGAGAG